jgi:pimeloyl-ACP methyl ester carboxylesterase
MTRTTTLRIAKRAAIAIVGIIAITAVTGATFESVMRRNMMRRHPAPGRMIDVGGRRVQIDCRGAGSPTVVLESGLDDFGSLSWAAVHDSIAQTSRVCAYSRAGIMWSDPADAPFDTRLVAHDLHAALAGAGEHAPWLMVGHSIGGPYITVFTALYPAEVAGLVYVDPSHPDQFAQYNALMGRRMEPDPSIVAVGNALAWSGLLRALPGDTPPVSWPRALTEAPPAFLPLSVRGMLAEMSAVDRTLAEAGKHRQFGDRPEVVLTAMAPASAAELAANGITSTEHARLRATSKALHMSQSFWSSRGRHELVADATHYIQLDRPDVVIRAVREVVAAVRVAPRTAQAAEAQP